MDQRPNRDQLGKTSIGLHHRGATSRLKLNPTILLVNQLCKWLWKMKRGRLDLNLRGGRRLLINLNSLNPIRKAVGLSLLIQWHALNSLSRKAFWRRSKIWSMIQWNQLRVRKKLLQSLKNLQKLFDSRLHQTILNNYIMLRHQVIFL